jgi:hypothetical protein
MAGWNPKMLSVQVPNVATKLSTLIAAKDATITTRLSMLIIEMDLAAAGNVYVGNSDVAANQCGANMVAGIVRPITPGVNSLILTTDIYVLATVNNAQINLSFIPDMM